MVFCPVVDEAYWVKWTGDSDDLTAWMSGINDLGGVADMF
jgi:hypothetical protein